MGKMQNAILRDDAATIQKMIKQDDINANAVLVSIIILYRDLIRTGWHRGQGLPSLWQAVRVYIFCKADAINFINQFNYI